MVVVLGFYFLNGSVESKKEASGKTGPIVLNINESVRFGFLTGSHFVCIPVCIVYSVPPLT